MLKTSACLGIQEDTASVLPQGPMPPATGDERESAGAERRTPRTSGATTQGSHQTPGLTWGRGPRLRPTRGDWNLRGPHQARSSKPSPRARRRPVPVCFLLPCFGTAPLLSSGAPRKIASSGHWRLVTRTYDTRLWFPHQNAEEAWTPNSPAITVPPGGVGGGPRYPRVHP